MKPYMKEIKRLFETIMPFKALKIIKIGGMTNVNYLLNCADNSYVLRLPPTNSNNIINRQKEEHIEKVLIGGGYKRKMLLF